MSEPTEKERVSRLFRLLEDSFKGELHLQKDGQAKRVGRIYPERRGFGKEEGRPDIVIWIELDTWVFGVPIKGKFPVLVEDEETEQAMQAAKIDYQTFLEKGETVIPILVIGGNKREEDQRLASGKVRLVIKQVPTRLVLRSQTL
jgi:hypothetical protein